MPIQTAADSISNSQGTPFGFKNRVMNGGMLIDQRNVGAAVASSTSAYAYMTDKFAVASSTDGGVSSQQVSDAPTGFTKSLKVTVTTADSSLSAAQRTVINHGFEGLNMADLNWGTSTAKPVTLSFWVKSSVTGTYSASFRTGNAGTSYTAPYTINSANTWEYKTITIPGATIGTWVTDNTTWAYLIFSLGIGSDYNTGTLNSWVSVSNGQGSTSHTSLMSTLNATWQVTGVQLEVGTQATSFDWRPYTTELQLCQRYFEKTYSQAFRPGQTGGYAAGCYQGAIYSGKGRTSSVNDVDVTWQYKVVKRAVPTLTFYSPTSGTAGLFTAGSTDNTAAVNAPIIGDSNTLAYGTANVGGSGNDCYFHMTASAEL